MKKLGRVLNTNTLMWEFGDGSGVPIPYEKIVEFEYYADLSRESGIRGAGAAAIGVIEKYKDWYNRTYQ
jgi:hypothetical protein